MESKPMKALFLVLLLAACSGNGDDASNAPPAPTGATLVISWAQPTMNVDGTPLTDITTYHVEYGDNINALTQVVPVPGAQRTVTLRVPAGTWHVGVRTINSAGEISERSAVATVVVQ
jgi:hypothetical protein